jgi:hypothetical protein
MRHYGYLVVEGPHDIEFSARLLKPFGFKRIQMLPDLDDFWQASNIIPSKFPYRNDLLKRVPVPVFYQTESYALAIHSASGYTRLAETIQETLISLPDPALIESIGVLLDADDQEPVDRRFTKLIAALRERNPELIFPEHPGQVTHANPATGIFILPDNHSSGTLENILLDAAEVNYPGLVYAASQYVQSINRGELDRRDLEELNKPAGMLKAQVGSMANILKPGKSVQVSIQDNRWLEGEALNLPVVRAISDFLAQLLGL